MIWPWRLFNCLVGLDQVHSTLFLLCHHLGWRSWLWELGSFSRSSHPFILRLKPVNQVSHLQWTLAMRGVVNTGMPPPWPSLHDCRIHQFPLSPPWYECYSQTTFSYQSYFKIRQFWNAIPCSELLRFLLKLQCHSIHSLLLLPNPASFLPLLQALVPRVFLHTNGHLRVCLLGTHLPRAGRNQGQDEKTMFEPVPSWLWRRQWHPSTLAWKIP